LKSIYNEPTIKRLTSYIFLKDFLIASDFLNKTEINLNVQLKAVLCLYIIYGSFPEISFQNVKVGKSSKKRNDGDFILKFNIVDKNKLDCFMASIFTEKGNLFENANRASFKNGSKKTFSYNLKISSKVFFDVNEFFRVKVQDINLRHIKLTTSLIYSNIPRVCNVRNIVKSTFFF
jgi:hypothetical protein